MELKFRFRSMFVLFTVLFICGLGLLTLAARASADDQPGQGIILTAAPEDIGGGPGSSVPQTTPEAPGVAVGTQSVAAGANWWNSGWSYRVPISVSAAGFSRADKPAEVDLNFTTLLASLRQSGALDTDSLRVIEVDANGNALDTNVVFQFDRVSDFNANSKARGTLTFLMKGNTAANVTRHYHVYFDVTGKNFTPASFTSLVTTTDGIAHKGFQSIRIVTTNGEYFYHKPGGGFATLLDANGNDWLGWNSSAGSAGDYRGIPNMVHPNDGGFFHPGRTTANTTLLSQGPLKATFRSTSNSGEWQVLWEVFPYYARMTVLSAPSAKKYWFLYEGTPGGSLQVNSDTLTRSNGSSILASGTWTTDIPNEEWVFVTDPNVGRSIYLAHHTDDTFVDGYSHMNGAMTVFGFGRNGNTRSLSDTGKQFTFGLVNATTLNAVQPVVNGAYKALNVTIGNAETSSATPGPTPTPTASTCPPPAPGNVIVNPGFESGTTNWKFVTNQKGSFTVTTQNPFRCDRSAQVAIKVAGTNVQLYQSGLPLQPNTAYRLTFAGRSTTGRDVHILLTKQKSPSTNYGIENVTLDLTTEWQTFTVDFTTKNFSLPVTDGRLRFSLSQTDAPGESFYFDDVSLVQVSP